MDAPLTDRSHLNLIDVDRRNVLPLIVALCCLPNLALAQNTDDAQALRALPEKRRRQAQAVMSIVRSSSPKQLAVRCSIPAHCG